MLLWESIPGPIGTGPSGGVSSALESATFKRAPALEDPTARDRSPEVTRSALHPHCPQLLSPQACTTPSMGGPRTTSVCRDPHDTDTTGTLGSVTATGRDWGRVSPVPSWPQAPSPHAKRMPFESIAQLCYLPHATLVTLLPPSPATICGCGMNLGEASPTPHWPWSFMPNANTVPCDVRSTACCPPSTDSITYTGAANPLDAAREPPGNDHGTGRSKDARDCDKNCACSCSSVSVGSADLSGSTSFAEALPDLAMARITSF